mgnify:CR=1 FL=1
MLSIVDKQDFGRSRNCQKMEIGHSCKNLISSLPKDDEKAKGIAGRASIALIIVSCWIQISIAAHIATNM